MQLANVLFEVEVATKALRADTTRVGFFLIVGMHVEGQVVHLMKCFVTYATLVLLLT